MDVLVSNLLMYGKTAEQGVLATLAVLEGERKRGETLTAEHRQRAYRAVRELLELATEYGFDENLWQNYLSYLLMMDENPFTLTAEKTGAGEGSVNTFVEQDFHIFRALFHYDFQPLETALGMNCFSVLTNYRALPKPAVRCYRAVSEKVKVLSRKLAAAESDAAFFATMSDFYRAYGVGKFGLNAAFRLEDDETKGTLLKAIRNMDAVQFSDLIGYETQKEELRKNTEAFLRGQRANNVLLYGDSGTGKSTSIKAVVNEYYKDGLRMIEIYKYQFRRLSEVLAEIKNRNYRFIIYMDDLSFEENESEYKFLKAVIEGGVETRPDNVLIYATSNRRHLIRESWRDRNDVEQDADIHHSDTMEEKLSLANRFGLSIGYYKPERRAYHEIVLALAERHGIALAEEELLRRADQFELRHGGVSGRTAQQFINAELGN